MLSRHIIIDSRLRTTRPQAFIIFVVSMCPTDTHHVIMDWTLGHQNLHNYLVS